MPPLDALTIHADFLRRMARALLRPGEAPDDLVQDTFVVAMQREPKDPKAVRPWLLGILRNQLRNNRRSTMRRDIRHRAGARPEALPATAELVEKEDIRRRVVDALMALDEPMRTTMVLRFYEQLPPRDVAAKMECPVETVRTRTRRGLEQMRKTLDDAHPSRKHWEAALLPWAAIDGSTMATPVASGAGRGALKLAGLALLVAAAIPVAVHVLGSGDSVDPESTTQVALSDDAIATDSSGAAPLVGQRAIDAGTSSGVTVLPGNADIPFDPAARLLRGTLALHGPLRGAAQLRARAMHLSLSKVHLPNQVVYESSFGDPLMVSLDADKDGAFAIDLQSVIGDPAPWAIEIEIRHRDYEPFVHMVSLRMRSKENGGLQFTGPEPTPEEARLALDAYRLDVNWLSLQEGTRLSGRARDEAGQPVVGATVSIQSTHAAVRVVRAVKTRADGTFVARLDGADAVRFVVEAPGLMTALRSVELRRDERVDAGTLTLNAGGTLRATIAGAGDGAALSLDAEIDPSERDIWDSRTTVGSSFVLDDVAYMRSQTGTMDAAGDVTVHGLAQGRRVRCTLQGHTARGFVHPSTRPLLTPGTAMPGDTLSIDLASLASVVVPRSGRDAAIRFLRLAHLVKGKPKTTAESPASGDARAAWLVVPGATYVLHTHLQGGQTHEFRFTAPGPGERTEIPAIPEIAGITLHVETDGLPANVIEVERYSVGNDTSADAAFSRQAKRSKPTTFRPETYGGAFQIQPLAPGRHLLRIAARHELAGTTSAFAPVNVIVDVPDTGAAPATIYAVAAGRLQLTIDTDLPVLNAQVRLRRTIDTQWSFPWIAQKQLRWSAGQIRLPLDAQVADPLPVGDYALEWQLDDGPWQREAFTIRANEATTLTLRF